MKGGDYEYWSSLIMGWGIVLLLIYSIVSGLLQRRAEAREKAERFGLSGDSSHRRWVRDE